MQRRFDGTVVCIGTGPSLTQQQIATARSKSFDLTGCNNVAFEVPDLAVLYGCNYAWWAHYWGLVRWHRAEKWTTNTQARDEFGVNWIAEKNAPGLSQDPKVIHHGHGSGYSLVNLVALMGARRIVLLGYDLKYAPDYDGRGRNIGSSPRHFFGEYPEPLQHWPSARVKAGIHEELLELYQSVADEGRVEIVNATPDSALKCFEKVPIERL